MAGSATSTASAAELARRLVEKFGACGPAGGSATSDFSRWLLDRYGERATVSTYERSFYTRDVAPMPGVVDWVFRTLPDLIARPHTTEEVADIVTRARREGVAITVRAGASTALGGSVPVRGGVVLDLSALKGVVALDLEARTARVRSGTVWTEFEHELVGHGLAPLAVPSSAPASSVGGWLCTGGLGVGSLRYGPFITQLRSIEVVLADGTIRRLTPDTDPPLDWFAGSEGTLGVVTEVELEVREDTLMHHVLLACRGIPAVHEVTRRLLNAAPRPYSIHFDDRHVVTAVAALGHAPSGWRQDRELVRIDWEGPQEELEAAEATVAEVAAAVAGTRRLSTEAAELEWGERFRTLRLKRGAPSLVGAEVLLPLSELEGYSRDVAVVARRYGTPLMTYGHVTPADRVIVMTMYSTNESKPMAYLLDLGLVKVLHDVGAAHGGVPYGLGFWNTPHVRPRLALLPLRQLQRRKHELDPAGVMNPGKGAARLALMNPSVVRFGMQTMATMRRVSRGVLR